MINEFYYKLLNIRSSTNISQKLKNIMENFNAKYLNIDKEQMCKVFSNNISKVLFDNRILNTKDEFGVYEHEIVLCRGEENQKIKYFLIDCTFSQFFYSKYYVEIIEQIGNPELFGILLKNGYVELSNQRIIDYLKIFNNSITRFDLDDYFNDLNKKV